MRSSNARVSAIERVHAALGLGIEPRIPGTDRIALVVEDADQAIGQLVEAVGTVGGVGAAGGARGRHH
ncbi:hypothetical protein, partial [Escherichia coli]|uniref:hypothetical protein n=1 Tax=Escherichia coli TaxID=562 RepID=UPI001954969B